MAGRSRLSFGNLNTFKAVARIFVYQSSKKMSAAPIDFFSVEMITVSFKRYCNRIDELQEQTKNSHFFGGNE
jgi:hypothetical protein